MPYTSFAVAGAGPTIGGRIVQARHNYLFPSQKSWPNFMTGADKPRSFRCSACTPWEQLHPELSSPRCHDRHRGLYGRDSACVHP